MQRLKLITSDNQQQEIATIETSQSITNSHPQAIDDEDFCDFFFNLGLVFNINHKFTMLLPLIGINWFGIFSH